MSEHSETRTPGPSAQLVTSAELVRSFAKWREASLSNPIHVTTHGRVSHVLTGVRLHRQMTLRDTDDSIMAVEERLTGLSEWVSESIILCNADEEIIFANRRARELCGIRALRPGMTLTEAIPAIEGTVMQVQYRRTLATRDAITADLPSIFAEGCWINLQTIPLGNRLVLMMQDITEEVQRYRMPDAREAVIDAISHHPEVGYVRLCVRGMIEDTDASFADWIGIAADKLHRVRFGDLVVRGMRPAFRKVLDAVLDDHASQRVELSLTPNHTSELRVHCSIVPLRGAYGSEGASIIMTRASRDSD